VSSTNTLRSLHVARSAMSIFAFIQAKQVGNCSSTFRFTSSENAHCAACLCAVERCENMATAVPYPCNRKMPSRCHTRRLQSDSSVPTWAVWCDSLTVVLLPCIPTLALVLVPNTNPHLSNIHRELYQNSKLTSCGKAVCRIRLVLQCMIRIVNVDN
jgi:hypothetical protein